MLKSPGSWRSEPALRIVGASHLWLSCLYAPFAPFSLERHERPSAGSLAKSLSFVAHRDLLRRQDDADRFPGVLGISVAGAHQSVALFEVDGRDGALRSPQAEELSSEQWPVISGPVFTGH